LRRGDLSELFAHAVGISPGLAQKLGGKTFSFVEQS
jgi:hypothetical protein